MRSKLIANAGCILSLILVLKSQPTIGKLEDKETNKEVLNKQVEQDYVVSERSIKRIEEEQGLANQYPADAIKKIPRLRNMLEQHALRLKRETTFNSGFAQHALRLKKDGFNSGFAQHALRLKKDGFNSGFAQHALRLKRGGLNSGFAHALRIRRGGGIGQRSSWGHALRVRSANMLNRGHALRLKRGPGDYRAFALRVKKDGDNSDNFLDESVQDPEVSDETMSHDVNDLENNYLDPEVTEDAEPHYQPDSTNEIDDMLHAYYGNKYLTNWGPFEKSLKKASLRSYLFPSRRLRSASFAHVLRV